MPKRTKPNAAGKRGRSTATKSKRAAVAAKPTLLSGGNPQIAKADGEAPVQAYIAAMPGWKSDVGRRLGRARQAHGPRRTQGRQMELAVLRRRGPGLVPLTTPYR